MITHPYWAQTYTGKAFDFLDPKPEQVCLEDVAHHLATAAIRYCGACREPYSVAQHSVWVADYLRAKDSLRPHAKVLNPYTGEEKVVDRLPHLEMKGLMHDTPEYVTGDMIRPWKRLLAFHHPNAEAFTVIKLVEASYLKIICQALVPKLLVPTRAPFTWVDKWMEEQVKEADNAALETERRDLLPQGWVKTGAEPWGPEIVPLGWRDAKDLFLKRFDELKAAMEASR